GLRPGVFGCSFRVPREKGAACRLLARWASSNCCLSRSFSSLSRSRSDSHCFSRRRNTSVSLRSRSFSWRTARHRCRSCSILRFHSRRVAENIGFYLRQLTLTKSEGFVQLNFHAGIERSGFQVGTSQDRLFSCCPTR